MTENCPQQEVADCHRPGSERGTSMLEIVLMISILSLMISGGVLMFEASSKQQAQGAAGQISPISAAVAATPEVADAQVANVDAAAKAEVGERSGVQDNTPAEADPERTKAVFSILAFFLALKIVGVAVFFGIKARKAYIAKTTRKISTDETDVESVAGLAMQIDDLYARHMDKRVVARGAEFCAAYQEFKDLGIADRHDHEAYPTLIRSVQTAHGLILKDVGRSAVGRRASSKAILLHLDRAIEAMSEISKPE